MKLRTLLTPLVALVLIAPLGAQIRGWIGDDGFNIPCCTPVADHNLPQFPAFELGGLYACLKDCNLEAEFDVLVKTQHIQVTCDLALIPFSVTDGAGGIGWTGTLIAKYARTWVEMDPANPNDQIQVWRWLVNTDAVATAGAAPCPIPPHPAGIDTHFTGHIDYACTTDALGNLSFRMAMNLNHLPGCISHNVFSASPLLPPPAADGHHDRSYHLAAPATFTFAPTGFPEGPTAGEAVRSTWLAPLPYTCLGEAQIEGGNLITALQNCLCGVAGAAGAFPWIHQFLDGFAVCPTTPPGVFPYMSLPVGPPAPPLPTGFVTLPLGSWGGLDPFPGQRELAIHFGLVQYQDPCNPNDLFHVVTGVSTQSLDPFREGFVFGGFNPGPFRWFTDLEDMIVANGLFGPYSLGFGTFFLSKVVWNLNLF